MEILSPRTIELLRRDRVRLLDAANEIDNLLREAGVENGNGQRNREHVTTGNRPGRKCMYNWDLGQQMYEQEGKSTQEVADVLGCSHSAVKSRKRDFGWARRGEVGDEVKKAEAKPDDLDGGPVSVECPECQTQTHKDPCLKCHTKLPTALAMKVRSI